MAIGAICIASSACAEDLKLATNPFNETVSETARIAGQFIAGLQMTSAPNADMKLNTFIPKEWKGDTICVRVATIEGLYLASNEYIVATNWDGGDTVVPYPPSDKNAALVGRAENSVGIRVARGACGEDPQDVALSSWGEAETAPGLLINSFQADMVFVYFDGVGQPVRCAEAALDTRISYDTFCQMPDPAPSGETSIQLLRIVDGDVQPPQVINLWLP